MMTRVFIPRDALITCWTAPFGVLFFQPCFSLPRLNASQWFSGVFPSFRTSLPQSLISFTALVQLSALITELETFLFQTSQYSTFSTILPNLFFSTETSSAFDLFLRCSGLFRNAVQKFPAISRSAIDEASSTIDAAPADEIHFYQWSPLVLQMHIPVNMELACSDDKTLPLCVHWLQTDTEACLLVKSGISTQAGNSNC